jgi:hypothetical protein
VIYLLCASPVTTDVPLLLPITEKPGKQKADSPQVKADKVDTKKKPKNLDGAKGTPGEILPSAKESKSAAKNAKTLKTKPAPEVKPGAHYFIFADFLRYPSCSQSSFSLLVKPRLR